MPCIGFLLCLNKGGSAMHRLPVVFKYKGTQLKPLVFEQWDNANMTIILDKHNNNKIN